MCYRKPEEASHSLGTLLQGEGSNYISNVYDLQIREGGSHIV